MTDESKRCCKCKETKLVSEFYKNKSTIDGLCFECKECVKSYENKVRADPIRKRKRLDKQKLIRDKNKESINKKNREWYANDSSKRTKVLEDAKKWRNANKQKKAETDSNYRINNSEKLKQYRMKNKDRISALFIKWRNDNREHVLNYAREYHWKHREKRIKDLKSYRLNNKDKMKEYAINQRYLLTGTYCLSLLRIPKNIVTPELIELKRAQLLLSREIKNASK